MTLKPDEQNDEISNLIFLMREAISMKIYEYSDARKNKAANTEQILLELTDLQEDFSRLTKMEMDYLKYKKASGQASGKHSDSFLNMLQSIKANVGQIVSQIPKANNQ